MADDVPPVVGMLTITISDPIKNDQGMVNSYISYKVNTETTMEGFECRQFSVIRRYSDFAWLRQVLSGELPAVIVPPLPEKAVMNRFSPEFVEGRRRALERFVSRCAEHPFIREAEIFKTFISGDDDKLSKAKTEAKKSSSSGGGWLPSSLSASSAQEKFKSPEDIKIEEISAYIAHLETQMRNVAKHTATLTKRGKELSQGLFDFGLAFVMLGQHETAALNSALSKMGNTADQLSLIASEQVEKEIRCFEEPIGDYIQLLGAAKEALDRRAALRKSYFACVGDLEAKQATLAQLKASVAAPTPALEAKQAAAEGAVTAAEVNEAKFKKELAQVTARLLGEVSRFKREKADEMRKVVLDYVQLQIEFNKKMEQQWADLVPEVEAIQVESVPSVSIFDGPLPASPALAAAASE